MGIYYSHETKYSSNKDEDGYSYYARFNRNYFAEGASRWAFKGELRGKGPKSGNACVAKVFKKEVAKQLESWAPDLSVLKKADKYARHFNNILLNIEPRRTISFPSPLVCKMDYHGGFYWLGLWGSGDDSYVKLNEYVAIEPFLEGTYKKFNSNAGYEDDVASKLLPAFTHWTFEQSGHNFMVCDLQGCKTLVIILALIIVNIFVSGVQSGNEYRLTDPVVHSAEQLYSGTRTDLGVHGMQRVMAGHKCNIVCTALNLSRNPVPYNPGLKRTSYDFELSYEEKQRNARKYSPYFSVIPE